MGNFSSQYLDEWQAVQKQEDVVNKEKAELTPKNKTIRCLPVDPRSPTCTIRRTPIQVERTPQKKKYTALDSSDENTLDFDECEIGEEPSEVNVLHESNAIAVKTAGNVHPAKHRSPLKKISKKKIDSPVTYLRYKQLKEIRDRCAKQHHDRTVEMNNVSGDN